MSLSLDTQTSSKREPNMIESVRRLHRWVAMIFILTVIVTAIVLAQKDPVVWVSYVPLFPLALLALSGIYMLARHYLGKGRRPRGGGSE